MKHKSFIRSLLCLLVCSVAVTTVRAQSGEAGSTVGVEQAIASKSAGDNAAPTAESGGFTLATLESGSSRLVASSPLQDAPVANPMYPQPDAVHYDRAPEPPVALLVLIGLLGLIVGRRRLR
ncbi:hypothetical protein FT643_13340 [Ketobacter sp. MCCC 1A13808]|uniref:hypothetical protein n=1 Tax=Ketobacter sp. MCCC 1A13808 TaxID=2602738 RepID=UPI000F2DA6D0|nr:hypothetical protein [Ketobacter sp. MCCC 1A13808]MVF13122.1 hypothetical protein [Ketobacter sp. MCCC 1A13808]RLP54769.1 MAG: hypothetical protein D6160_08095 [Ketobacter sp.]